jgi:hypothetical protein
MSYADISCCDVTGVILSLSTELGGLEDLAVSLRIIADTFNMNFRGFYLVFPG